MAVSRIPRPVRLLVLLFGALLAAACQPSLTAAPSAARHDRIMQAPASDACHGTRKPGLREVSVTSAGKRYQVPVHFPRGYTNSRRVPLLLDLHGSSSNGLRELRFSGLDHAAGRDGFLVAAPNGAVRQSRSVGENTVGDNTGGGNTGHPSRLSWNVPGVPLAGGQRVPEGTRSDVRFLRDVIDQLSSANCVNQRKIYVAGFSGGARMASALACQDAGRIAGIIAVSGLRAGPSNSGGSAPQPGGCSPGRPLSVIAFHGVADRTAPYYGHSGEEWRYSVPSALREWAALNGCAPRPVERRPGRRLQLTDYQHCAMRDGTPTKVQLWAIRGGGHRWPGNDNRTAYTEGRATHEVSVTDVVGRLLRDDSA